MLRNRLKEMKNIIYIKVSDLKFLLWNRGKLKCWFNENIWNMSMLGVTLLCLLLYDWWCIMKRGFGNVICMFNKNIAAKHAMMDMVVEFILIVWESFSSKSHQNMC